MSASTEAPAAATGSPRAQAKAHPSSKSSRSKSKFTARTADKHILYQLSVQDPATEVSFISHVFYTLRGRRAMSVREDFCGTALFCAEWVKSHRERTAIGVDIDPEVLSWGIEHNLKGVEEPGDRITLYQQDVMENLPGSYDVTVAFNFSYWIFSERSTMLRYFKNVRRSLQDDGVVLLDAYGGFESQQVLAEPRRVRGGFTYVWDQARYNPIDHSVLNHIHFRFEDGSKLEKAFSYAWRFWTLPELKELLLEAGFSSAVVYWEEEDDKGEGTGVFRPRKIAQNDAAWIAYIVAEP